MEITINLMTVLYVVLAYLAVGFIIVLTYNVIELKDNKRMLSEDEFKKNIFKSLYRSLIFSWAFPYLLYTEIPERVKKARRDKLENGYFLNENGEPMGYEDIKWAYAEYAEEHVDDYYISKEKDVYKYTKESYTTAK